MNKRLISVVLALSLVLALLLPGPVLAAEADIEGEGGIMPINIVDDHTPPVVEGVYMNSPGATVTVGDKISFKVITEDENDLSLSASRLRFTYICEQGHEHNLFSRLSYGTYDAETKTATIELTIDDSILNGTYKLSQVDIDDIFGNYELFYPQDPRYPNDPGHPGNIDFDSVSFTVIGSPAVEDHIPPAVYSVYMQNPGQIASVGDTISFYVHTEDDSPISPSASRLRFTYLCEQSHEHILFSRLSYGTYDEETKMATFVLPVDDTMLNGIYKLSQVDIDDIFGNYELFYPQDPRYPYDPGNPGNIDFDSVSFTVTGSPAIEDHTPPAVYSVYMQNPGQIVSTGDTISFCVHTEDDNSISPSASRLRFTYICEQGHEHNLFSRLSYGTYDEETKIATFILSIDDTMLNGTYKLSQVDIDDTFGNYELFYPQDPRYPYDSGNPGSIDFDSVYFTIATPEVLPDSVTIPDSTSLSIRSTQVIYPTVEPAESIPDWTWTSDDPDIVTIYTYDKGKAFILTGISAGTTTITGTTSNDLTATCEVTVTEAPLPESGTIEEKYNVGVGGYKDIIPVLTPPDATSLFEATSDNPHVASIELIDGGRAIRILGNNAGHATITIRGANGLKMTTEVQVGRDEDRQHEKEPYGAMEATCWREGYTEGIRCSACRHVFQEPQVIQKLSHTPDPIPECPATCYSEGSTGGSRCSVCWETLEEPTILPIVDHNPIGDYVTEATCYSEGYKSGTYCSYCYEQLTEPETIPVQDHTPDTWTVVTAATATEDGLEEGTCKWCGTLVTRSIPATGEVPEPTPQPTPDPNPGSGSGGGGSSSGSSSGSSGSGGSYRPSTPSTPSKDNTIQVPTNDDSLSATIKDNTAQVSASEKEIKDVLESAAESGKVTLDVSKDERVEGVSIPQNLVEAINDSEDVSSLSIQTPAGKMELDDKALNTLGEAMTGEKDTVTFEIEPIDPDDIPSTQKYPIASVLKSAVFVNLTAVIEHRNSSGKVTGTDRIHEFGGEVTVSMPYEQPENMAGRQIIACYIADDGSITYFPVHYVDGIATFTTTHFSSFAIFASRAAAFQDVDLNSWYAQAVEYVAENGMMLGVDDTTFDPSGTVTRAMVVTILWRLENMPVVNYYMQYQDIDYETWYTEAVRWASSERLVEGYDITVFGPDDPVTREQLATILYRYAKYKDKAGESSGSLDGFADTDRISGFAKDAMAWAVGKELVTGTGDSRLDPLGEASRAQIATIFQRFCQS